MTKRRRYAEQGILAGILLAYIILGTLYAVLTPPWQVPDEPAHYNYVRFLIEERRLPVLRVGDYDQAYLGEITTANFDPRLSIEPIRYEYHQPPLYYLLAAPVYAAFGGALLPLRLLSVALGTALLITAYRVGKVAYPNRAWLALGAAALIAFIPQHIAMTAGVENDTLAELLLAVVLLRLVRWLQEDKGGTRGALALTGVVIGLALLTKAGVYITVPLAAVAVWLKTRDRDPEGEPRLPIRQAWKALAWLLLPALLLSLPWFLRNALQYGGLDILGLQQHSRVVAGQPRTAQWIADYGLLGTAWTFLRTTFHSFWGQFGWMAVPMDSRVYDALWILSAVVALGFLVGAADARDQRNISPSSVLLGCSALLTLATYLGYNLTFYQAQGRYLFPALIPIGLGWSAGLYRTLRRRDALLTGIALAAATLIVGVRWIFQGCGSKWRIVINATAAAFYGLRWLVPDKLLLWFLGVPYLLLAALAAASPFWFIRPYLTP